MPLPRYFPNLEDIESGDEGSSDRLSELPATRDRWQAFTLPMPMEIVQNVRENYLLNADDYPSLSMTELVAFICEDCDEMMEDEKEILCTNFFGFRLIQQNPSLVYFYTGLPTDTKFCYVTNIIQGIVFADYITWDNSEKLGFITHTMMVLMKLRLNMTDEELGERFMVEPYVVNMTVRTWLPAIYEAVYLQAEKTYRMPSRESSHYFTKIVDVIEICKETPEASRVWRDEQHERMKAVLGVRADGYVCFASKTFNRHQPDEICLLKSQFRKTITRLDVVQTDDNLKHAISSLGVANQYINFNGYKVFDSAVNRIAQYRILQAMPTEYFNCSHQILAVCAALTNFVLEARRDDIGVDDVLL